MSMFLSLDGWQVLDGRLVPLFQNANVWDVSNEAAGCLVDDYVIADSPPPNSWLGYGMEDSMVMGSDFKIVKPPINNYLTMHANQQVHAPLSSSREDSYFTDSQIRQVAQLLQTDGCGGVLPAGYQYLNMSNYGSSLSPTQNCNLIETQLSFSSALHLVLDAGAPVLPPGCREAERLPGENVMDMLTELCDTIDGDMISDQAELASFDSFLLPVSSEDVDSLLSSDSSRQDAAGNEVSIFPPVVVSTLASNDSDEALSDGGWSSVDSAAVVPQVVRKKEQNKTAALRYRQKKRSEHGSVLSVCDELESRNVELKTKVTEMEREINYLKGLIAEINA